MSLDSAIKKTVLRKIPHGLFIVGVCNAGKVSAFTATWLTQASFDPPRLVMAVRRDSGSFEMIQKGGVFSLNLLAKDRKDLAQHFVKPAKVISGKLEGIAHDVGQTGAPILDEAIAWIECRVQEIANEGGDHALVVGEVVAVGQNEDVPALTLMDTGWHYGG